VPDACAVNVWAVDMEAEARCRWNNLLTAIDQKRQQAAYYFACKAVALSGARPLAFSDGTTMESSGGRIAPEGQFLVL